MLGKMWDEITCPFPNFNGCTIEVWEWISNFFPHFITDVITYPCWDYRLSMLVKGAHGGTKWHLLNGNMLLFNITWHRIDWWCSYYTDIWFQYLSIGQFYPYPSGLLHWCWDNNKVALVPLEQAWGSWQNRNYNHNKTNHNQTINPRMDTPFMICNGHCTTFINANTY